jgi:hypothetical protein
MMTFVPTAIWAALNVETASHVVPLKRYSFVG